MTYAEWMAEGLSACRAIMGMSPQYFERALQVRNFAAQTEAHLPEDAPGEHWFRVRENGSDDFICWRNDHTGQYEGDANALEKAGIDPASLPVLEIDPNRHTVAAFAADFQTRLDAALKENDGTNFTDEEKPQMEILSQCVAGLQNTSAENYTDTLTADGLKTLLPKFLPEPGSAPTLAERLGALEGIQQSAQRMRKFFVADVFLAARLTAFPSLLLALAEKMKAAQASELEIDLQMTRFFMMPYSEAKSRPPRLLPALVEKMAYEGHAKIVETLAAASRQSGFAAIEAALDAKTVDEYAASLYGATVDCFASSHLYEILDADAKQHPERDGGTWWAQSAKVAEEKLVRCANALFRLAAVPLPDALDAHRARIRQAIKTGGPDAGAHVVSDLIENNYFYPRFFEKILTEEN